jgi:DNA-binding GntR family transcriptional regulator
MAPASVSLSPIRRSTLTQEVIGRLRRAILSGELTEGMPLPETHTADRLGVSRVPVREALVELERQGLVEFSGHGRARVRAFTEEDVRELLSLRATLQAMAARLAAARLTDLDQERLEALLARSSRTHELTEFSRLDAAFHDEIVAIARHGRLSRIWGDLRAQMELWLARLHRRRDRARHDVRQATLDSHRKMLGALATRDPKAAGALMERHCSSWSEHLSS